MISWAMYTIHKDNHGGHSVPKVIKQIYRILQRHVIYTSNTSRPPITLITSDLIITARHTRDSSHCTGNRNFI